MSTTELQLFVIGVSGKTTVVFVNENATVTDLKKKMESLNGIPYNDIRLQFTSKELQDDEKSPKTLKSYGIENKSSLFVVLRLDGGSKPLIKQFGRNVVLTSAQDVYSQDESKEGQRIEMICGHAIGPASLTEYIRKCISNGTWQIVCPYPACGTAWEYASLKYAALLTTSERIEFEKGLNKNFVEKSSSIKQCPFCESYCVRKNEKNVRVTCILCRQKGRNRSDFCWYCLKEWCNPISVNYCGHKDCCTKKENYEGKPSRASSYSAIIAWAKLIIFSLVIIGIASFFR